MLTLDTTFKVKDVIDEDYINYKKCSMFIATNTCNFKCEHEDSNIHCQNSSIVKQKPIETTIRSLIKRFDNSLAKAVVFGGLEPFDQFYELVNFIISFRLTEHKNDIVIYTGYTEEEVANIKLHVIDHDINAYIYWNIFDIIKNHRLSNVIIKFGRYKSNLPEVFDELLGVKLISNNQYAKIY